MVTKLQAHETAGTTLLNMLTEGRSSREAAPQVSTHSEPSVSPTRYEPVGRIIET